MVAFKIFTLCFSFSQFDYGMPGHGFLYLKKKLFIIYFWLCWVFIAVHGLSLVAASGGYSSLRCVSFSLWWLLLLWSTGSRCTSFSSCSSRALERRLSSCSAGSVAVAHGLSCSAACGIFPDQGSNPCPRIGRWVLNHCATREVPGHGFLWVYHVWGSLNF